MGEIWLLIDSSGMGGIESHVGELAEGLSAAGRQVRTVFLQDHGPHPLKDRLTSSGLPWEICGGGRKLLNTLRHRTPYLLHTHGYKSGIVGRLAAAATRTPCVSTFHAGEITRGSVALYDAADRWTSIIATRVAVSRPILARIPYAAHLVPNFVSLPPNTDQLERPDSVAFVGRMSHEKGPDLFASLACAAPGPTYLAYGDGPELANCVATAGAAVTFRGAVAGMASHWSDIGLLAITSRAEGLPLAALEAMANGVTVAAFAVGGMPDLITHGVDGYLVPPGDVPAFAAAVAAWRGQTPGARMAMSQAARNTISAGYGREAGVAALLAIYDRAAR